MKISRDWLSDFIEWTETDPQLIADRLTRCTGEVEEVIEQGTNLENVAIGRLLTIDKHPNADKLSVCTVQTERGNKTVVCGGTNLKMGMIVAFAHVGANLTSAAKGGAPVMIARVNIRGVASEGMICAAEELHLQDEFPPTPEQGSRPVMDLSEKNFKPGTLLRQALGLNDVVFHIDNHAITNRSDLFSHIGIARELVAIGIAKWKKLPPKKKASFPKTDLPFKRVNEIPHLVPRYCACAIAIDDIGATPDWMRRRLISTGYRPINLPVDITNYVSMELGMPLHSFDVADMEGTVRIRTSKKGEKLTTLDEVERALPEGAVVLSDDRGLFDLLGIMGGLRSSTKDTSRNLYLHAAIVDPAVIRRTIIATGHRTDAATVYEKGIPRIAARSGFLRALELFLALAPGARVISRMESAGKDDRKKTIAIPSGMFSAVIGTDLKAATVKRTLSDLGFSVRSAGKSTLTVTPPPWRNDVLLQQDVIEEVARIFGYANVPTSMPEALTVPPQRDQRIHRMRDALKESGFSELIHLAFSSPQVLAKMDVGETAVTVENPIGEEVSVLRPSLLPSMFLTAARELKTLETKHLKTFEIGHAFSRGEEWNELAALIAARGETTIKDDPLLMLKSDLIRAFAAAGHTITVRPSPDLHSLSHPGRCAELLCGEKRIGLLFEVHPNIRTAVDLPFRAAACVIDADSLLSLTPETQVLVPLPAFPSITLDETVPLGTGVQHAQIVSGLLGSDPLLQSVETVDLYEAGKTKTMTLRFTYRAADRTLTQEEVEKVHSKVLAELKKR